MSRPPAACLIGWPAAHSRSPLIHHYWLRTLGIEGGYVIEAVPPDEFKDFLFRLSHRGFVGGNDHRPAAIASVPPAIGPRTPKRSEILPACTAKSSGNTANSAFNSMTRSLLCCPVTSGQAGSR